MAYQEQFHWADYLVFAISLTIGLIVGIIFAIKDKWHKQSSESYLMANRQMNWILVGFSFWATVISAIFFIGLTTEFYYLGMTMLWINIARFPAGAFVILIIIPKYYRLNFRITSAYEYFEHRFNLAVRMTVGVIYVILTLLMMAVVLFTPGLILSSVSVLNIYWGIAISGIVCVCYTVLGGMKAVIWVDSIQLIIMLAGVIVVVVKGVLTVGGMANVWHYYADIGQRDNWDDLNPEPWNRHTVWNTVFLFIFIFIGKFGVNQNVLQRYMTVNDMKYAQWSVFLGIIMGTGFSILVFICGMAAFANVGGDEPMLNIVGQKRDQILPYFIMHLLGDYHGIPGLVVASLFAAALSTLSSGQNALATVITKDFIQQINKLCTQKDLKANQIGNIARITAAVVGIVTLALSMVVPYFNDTLISMALSVESFIVGPILGLMVTGFFCFWVEEWGALVGVLCSLGWGLMMYFGALFHSNPIGWDAQPWFNNSFSTNKTFKDQHVTPVLFDVSYTWYVFLDVMVVIIVASVVSIIIHCIRHKGNVKIIDIMPPKDLRYTIDDFKAAFSCRNTIKQDDHPSIDNSLRIHKEEYLSDDKKVEQSMFTEDLSMHGVVNSEFVCTHL